MAGHRVAPHPPLETPVRDVFALAAFVGGFLLGLFQPLVAVAISAGLAVGPTFAGLALVIGIAVFVPSLFGAAMFRTGRSAVVPLALVSGTLVVGVLGGTVMGAVLHVPTRSDPPAIHVPTSGPQSFPVVLDSPGAVSLRLEAVDGYAPAAPTPIEGGLFGHWCYSGLDSTNVARLEAELGTIGDRVLIGTVLLGDAGSRAGHVQLLLRGDGGEPWIAWSGDGTIADRDGTTGRITFAGLVADPPSTAGPATLAGEITWRCSAWQP
jgi:hypothetical protein